MGAAPNPLCWDGRRARGLGEPNPSIFIQLWPRPSGVSFHHPHPALHGPAQHRSITPACRHAWLQPFASWCPGVPLRAHPPILLSLPGSFLQSLATGAGQGQRECQRHGGIAARPARANPPSVRIRPPSSFTSCLGPWEKERREMSRSWGSAREGSVGRNTRKPQEKILCILRKCQ